MEKFILENDLHLLYVAADSFPDGIMKAFDQLAAKVHDMGDRIIYGISKPEAGKIQYKAAASQFAADEPARLNCNAIVIAKGTYLTETIINFMSDVSRIGTTFTKLLADPRLDPSSYCVEWYKGKDVVLMVKINA